MLTVDDTPFAKDSSIPLSGSGSREAAGEGSVRMAADLLQESRRACKLLSREGVARSAAVVLAKRLIFEQHHPSRGSNEEGSSRLPRKGEDNARKQQVRPSCMQLLPYRRKVLQPLLPRCGRSDRTLLQLRAPRLLRKNGASARLGVASTTAKADAGVH